MRKEECYELGYVSKTHALDGEIAVILDVDYPEDYIDLESVFIEMKGDLVPYFVETSFFNNDKFILKLEDIDTVEDAAKLKSKILFLPLSVLPKLENDQFYFHEVIGYSVTDDAYGELGDVSDVYKPSSQAIMTLYHQGKEVMIPMTEEIIQTVNHEEKKMQVKLPEGLIELYLES
ncbi:MAG: ribosome maturation factor RimM [Flammeovirgaceae bacterium]|nr:ribosome maturation factor RimM [Flammeovirgaceae bacterium]